jgi:uncharacterized delta-60 repeat protein
MLGFGRGLDWMARRGLIALLALVAPIATQAVTFGDAGIAIPPIYIPGGDAYPTAVVVQSDGKVIVAGTAAGPIANTMFAARFTSAGALDASYGVDGLAFVPIPSDTSSLSANAAVLDGQGNLLLAGAAQDTSPFTSIGVARLTSSGTPDATFGLSGFSRITFDQYNEGSSAAGIVLDSSGRIVVAGQVSDSSAGRGGFAVVRLTSNGALDTTFNGTGQRVINLSPYTFGASGVAIDGFDNVFLIGFDDPFSSTPFALVKLTSSGQFDTTFNGSGIVHMAVGNASTTSPLAIDPSGRILVAGKSVSSSTTYLVTRLTAAGAPDASFGSGGSAQFDLGSQLLPQGTPALALDSLGRIVLSFSGFDVQQGSSVVAARLQTNGALDPTFNGSGFQSSPLNIFSDFGPVPLAIDQGGNVVVGHVQREVSSVLQDVALMRFTVSGVIDTTFNGTGKVVQNCGLKQLTATGMARQTDGKLVVAGYTSQWANDASTDFIVARLTTSGALDTTFNGSGFRAIDVTPTGPDIAYAVAIDQGGRIVLAGADALSNMAVARLTSTGTLDPTFNGSGTKVVGGPRTGGGGARGLAIDAGGNIVLTGQAPTWGTLGFEVVRLTPAGALDPSFASGGVGIFSLGPYYQNQARRIGIDSAGRIIVSGSVEDPASVQCNQFAAIRLTSAGVLDVSFAGSGIKIIPSATSCIEEADGLAIDSGDRIVLVGTASPFLTPSLVRLTSAGALDATFTALDSNDFVTNLDVREAAFESSGKIVVVGSSSDMGVVKFTANGAIDTTFNAGEIMNVAPTAALLGSTANAVALEAPAGIYLAGTVGRGIAVVKLLQGVPTTVEIALLDDGFAPRANTPFDVLVQARDDLGNPQPVSSATTIALSLHSGTGVLSGGLSCIIPAGTTTCWLLGVTYSKFEWSVVLTASAIGGDPLNSSDSTPFLVTQAQSATTLAADINPAAQGQVVTLTATVTAPLASGGVMFFDGSFSITGCAGVPLVGSGGIWTATCTTRFVTPGTHQIQASYGGDVNTQGSTSAWLPLVITGARVNVALAANGAAVFSSSPFNPAYPTTAIIDGDRAGLNFGNGGVWRDATPGMFPDSVQIDFSGPATIDQVIVYSVQDNDLSPVDPSDTLTFTRRGITAFNVQTWDGFAWVTIGSVTGNKLVKRAVNFAATTTGGIRVVINGAAGRSQYSYLAEIEAWTPAPPPPPGTALVGSPNPAKVGQNVVFTATVGGPNPSGTVAFSNGGAPIPACATVPLAGSGNTKSAQCTTSFPLTGVFSIVARYSGDGNNPASSSAPVSEVVKRRR